jgi:DNA-binding response OmpR family regulator
MTRITNPTDLPQAEAKMPSNGKRILIAEDDPFISRMYETKLANSGFEVLVKNNGRDAYQEIKDNQPDLVMLDINMPELTGFEVLSALKNDGFDFNSCPVLVLTNSSNQEHRDLAKGFGVDYLIKAEMTPRDVLERIKNKLNLTAPPETATPPAS